jgi:hypothetical protein
MKKTALVVLMCALLGACGTPGTKVTSDGGSYKSMASSQQWWCNSVGGCDCTIDGMKATCSLAQSCVSSGNCKAAP